MKMQLTAIAALLISQPLFAESNHRQHDAHVHGSVEFNIAQDANDLLIEITAPGADVVGFESAPKNDSQKAKLQQAQQLLSDASALIKVNAQAQCQLTDVLVNNTLENKHDSHDEHDHDKHNHDEHDHDKHDHDEHDHDKHDHDEHDHDKHDHDEHDHGKHDAHGEFSIQYQFTCQAATQLKNVDTTWFNHFPSTESITVNLLTDKTQKALRLSPSNTVITF
jgi:hypothetical protein